MENSFFEKSNFSYKNSTINPNATINSADVKAK